jgi:fumarate reductase flavoprotein subunit
MCPEASKMEQKIEADLVVIGGGGAGLSAALTAAENGLKKIIVLEKRGGLGGNTAMATGLFACESPAQARQHIIADTDVLFKRAMEWARWSRVNPRIFRAFLSKSGDTIRWLEQMGLEFNVIAFFPNQEPRVEHVPRGRGAHLTKVLTEKCLDSGVQLLLHAAGKKILLGKKKQVTGILAVQKDEQIKIDTQNIVIATGGFAGNKNLLRKYCPLYYDGFGVRGLPLTGDGLLMAQEAGAAIEDFVTLIKEGPRVDLHTWPLMGVERDPVTVWVNNRGERFADEAVGAHPFEAGNAILRQPDKISYSLLDTSIVAKMSVKLPELDKALKAEAKRDRVKIAESWDDIAVWIGARPSALKASIEQYNSFCSQGYDETFAKERRWLLPLCRPPYYAIKCQAHILDTIGGIRINEYMEVLDNHDEPIRGLYAAGTATSGWQAETYCSDLSGSAFGYAINSGRIAGENAAIMILKNK